MKQIYSSSKSIVTAETSLPAVSVGSVLIKVAYSCISAGTEMTSVNSMGKSLLRRALDNPAQVKQAIDILKTQGLKKMMNKVDSSVEKLSSLGYSISGEIVGIGKDVTGLKIGDKVSAGGAGLALHAEYVSVPKNLVVRIPDNLDLKYASIGTVGSIAMQGVRRAGLTLGEYGIVFGTGLLGFLTLQMLKTSGVKVACIDINSNRLNIAKKLGADRVIDSTIEDPVLAIQNWTSGFGADAVIFTAATHQNEPLSQAFQMCRKKGKVVLVGVSGMNINRGDIYAKEIDFLISTSYGPGRYDSLYEQKGIDYPYAYVRWTENRNISSFLDLLSEGKINIDLMNPIIYSADEADKAYDGIKDDPGNHIVTFLEYPKNSIENERKPIKVNEHKSISKNIIKIGLIGAGNFAASTLLPIIAENKDKFYLKTIVNRSGDKALNVARQFNAENTSSDKNDIMNDPDIDLVMICTRHGNHANLVLEGLQHGKHVYVEKPLATTMENLQAIEDFYRNKEGEQTPCLIVGFNRRYSDCSKEIKKQLENRTAPVFVHYRMNAGFAPFDAWVHEDGGRIIGEGCHLIDLMQYITGSEIVSTSVAAFRPQKGQFLSEDNRSLSLEFADGSMAVIDYFSCGNKAIPKEYMEVHWENKSIIMNDYQLLTGYGVKVNSCKSIIAKKGHKEEWLSLYDALRKGQNPISLDSLFTTTKICIEAANC